jgi:hypothetical protein
MSESPSPADPEEEPVTTPVVIPPPGGQRPATHPTPSLADGAGPGRRGALATALGHLFRRHARPRRSRSVVPTDGSDDGPLVIDLLAPPPNRHRSRDRTSS